MTISALAMVLILNNLIMQNNTNNLACSLLPNESSCINCGACRMVCPKNVLDEVSDAAGFRYAHIANPSQCIGCGQCIVVCPALNPPTTSDQPLPKGYAAWHKDLSIIRKSTSGGAFTALAQAAFMHGYAVAGVCLDGYSTRYAIADNMDALNEMRGSKYIPSSIGEILPRICKQIAEGHHILVTGTPCQLAALRNVLTIKKLPQENIITCEIICTGTPSPVILQKECATRKMNLRSFRDKIESPWKKSHGLRGENLQNGDTIRIPLRKSPFYSGFSDTLILKKACYNCHFGKLPRCADITIGDFWGSKRFLTCVENGLSAILTNSPAGERLLKDAKTFLNIYPVTLNDLCIANPRIYNGLQPRGNSFFRKLLNTACKHFPWPLIKLLYGGTYQRFLLGKIPFELLYSKGDKKRIRAYRDSRLRELAELPDFNIQPPYPKIGILTFHKASNFGAILQTYALQQTLSELKPEAQISVLDFTPSFMNIKVPFTKPRKRAQRICFLDFIKQNINLSTPIHFSIAKATEELKLDAIIVGSDQVWNPFITKDTWKEYFLENLPISCKKFAYSASFGYGKDVALDKDTANTMGALINQFHGVSLRERSGLDICQELGYRGKAIHTLDPVLTANPTIFFHLLKEACNSLHAITAVLLDESPAHRKLLKAMSKKNNLPCQIIAVKQSSIPTPGIHRPFKTTIPNYLAAIKNAHFVITDSYHAVMFSLIFQRPFAVTPSIKNKRFERLADILNILGLEDRIVENHNVERLEELMHTPINYGEINAIIDSMRKQSRNYLKHIFDDDKEILA